MRRQGLFRTLVILVMAMSAGQMVGCTPDSFFDPSRTGRFDDMPTTIPILTQIDVIENENRLWSRASGVTPEDLVPNDLSYRMAPGDIVTVEVYELVAPNAWHTITRRIDAGGYIRVTELGDVPSAGLTQQEFEDLLTELYDKSVLMGAQVEVVVEEGGGFQYTVYGFIQSPGRYLLRNPNLKLLDALAVAGGVPVNTEKIYIIRNLSLHDNTKPAFEDRMREQFEGRQDPKTGEPLDVESLIEQLNDRPPSPGAFRMEQDGFQPIDIDDLEPVQVDTPPQVDVDDVTAPMAPIEDLVGGDVSYIFDENRGEWIPVRSNGNGRVQPIAPGDDSSARNAMVVERIIEVPYQKLSKGDTSYNVIIRPDDLVYIAGPDNGVVYIDGLINRPGVYQLPNAGKLTLSRLIAAAGGLGQLAIPENVDLTRVVGESREATVRVNLAAIRQRTEPDLYLKPDDHIIVGTNFWATPLAIIRNGFRATYGFGFLLDRNFGNDVFGAPPTNQFGN
jgi:polysaccharide export outer membrane protein